MKGGRVAWAREENQQLVAMGPSAYSSRDAARPSRNVAMVNERYEKSVRIALATLVIASFIIGIRLPGVALEVTQLVLALMTNSEAMETAKLIVSIAAVVLSLAAILTSALLTRSLKRKDVIYERRRLFITALWDKLISVRAITPKTATAQRVIDLLNTLALVAFCWENEIADRELIARGFGSSYGEMVDNIQGIVSDGGYDAVIEAVGSSGPELLQEHYDRVVPVRLELDKYMKAKGIHGGTK